jgi:hypothetical protein
LTFKILAMTFGAMAPVDRFSQRYDIPVIGL